MSAPQGAVWMDHHEARVFRVEGGEKLVESAVVAPPPHGHRHPKGGTAEHNHPDDQHRYFTEVAQALEGLDQILVVGPSTAKLQFLRYLQRQAPRLEARVVSVETVDHPSHPQLMAYVRRHFGLADRQH